MFAYFVVVQVIMTTAADKWGDVFSSVDAVGAYLVAYPAKVAGSVERVRAAMAHEDVVATMVMPSLEEARGFLLPRLVLVIFCVLVVVGARLGLDALKSRIPATGISLDAVTGAAGKAAAGAPKKGVEKSAKTE